MQKSDNGLEPTRVHGPQHACDKLVYSITLLDQRNKGRDTTLVAADVPEMRKDEFLKLLNLVLQVHQVRDCLVSDVQVVGD